MCKLLQWLFIGHVHKWEIKNIYNYYDSSYGIKNPVPSSIVTRMCTVCKECRQQTMYGAGHIKQ